MPSFNNESHINALETVLAYVEKHYVLSDVDEILPSVQILTDYLNTFDEN